MPHTVVVACYPSLLPCGIYSVVAPHTVLLHPINISPLEMVLGLRLQVLSVPIMRTAWQTPQYEVLEISKRKDLSGHITDAPTWVIPRLNRYRKAALALLD